ncbi:hypothetical protein PGT21_033182 [Puccinia graminis f. sp. tritici]|uniref:Uncharacterized protein n=1 Tax=Puccinia graminis f. sp. tritici TaxID=56615 RepID=A0A5B0PDM2_PUCGR|nr:hypothetical protein PGT21_033182 [Puccinia graminis f. sp. tritici]KAA1099146.1 hypothetical protein PGTUg99_001495 [Puccinia graminis f. sp. tritici]
MDFHKFTAQDPRGEEGDVAGLSRFVVAGLSTGLVDDRALLRNPSSAHHEAHRSCFVITFTRGAVGPPKKHHSFFEFFIIGVHHHLILTGC